ncbi:hypothetical protein PIB30_090202 [Stylosanthes scabra]|uniref:Uncharacterized protein n=1 Tax=Stylosanthes scabra TaxID=79078 RepID=A0ABU6VXU6_9FABA|nr:hypothetical protein [Stylosanthes scabra]
MEVLSMFQGPRTVALEDEKPGTYERCRSTHFTDCSCDNSSFDEPRPYSRHNLFGFPYNDIKTCFQRIRESRINPVATPRAERSSQSDDYISFSYVSILASFTFLGHFQSNSNLSRPETLE